MSWTWPLRAASLALALAPMIASAQVSLPLMRAPGAGERVLVIAPHPDDETLCCAGLLQRARANGAAVGVVWITAGDAFELDAMLVEHTPWPNGANLRQLGVQRLAEARAAAEELGVPAEHQYFLGYPDRGVVPLLSEFYSRTFVSTYTGLSAVPYPQALRPGAAYTGANLERDLADVLDQFRPTLVLAAAPQDLHPDHQASGALARRLLERRGELAILRYWIVHASSWPSPRRYEPQLPLQPPESAPGLAWEGFSLSDAERAHKLAALRAHRSQMELISPLMLSFVRVNELYAPAR